MLGKQDLMSYFASQLHVTIGELRADGLFSLNNTSCSGICDQGLAGLVNGHVLTVSVDSSHLDNLRHLL